MQNEIGDMLEIVWQCGKFYNKKTRHYVGHGVQYQLKNFI